MKLCLAALFFALSASAHQTSSPKQIDQFNKSQNHMAIGMLQSVLSPQVCSNQDTFASMLAPGKSLSCRVINSYPRESGQMSFLDETMPGPCTYSWDISDLGEEGYLRHLDGCQGEGAAFSTNQMKEYGFDLLTSLERAKRTLNFAKPTNLFKSCCGSDRQCELAMQKVNIKYCSPSKHQDAEDPCTTAGGWHNFGEIEWAQIMRSAGVPLGSTSFSRPKSLHDFYSQVKTKAPDFVALIAPSREPQPGYIELSPYTKRLSPHDEDVSDSATLTHEYGHACSAIRAQMYLQSKNEELKEGAMLALAYADSCEIHPPLLTFYEKLYSDVGMPREVLGCLVRMAQTMKDDTPRSPACKDVCPSAVLEESFAEAFEIVHAVPDLNSVLNGSKSAFFPSLWPGRVCFNGPRDQLHPLASDVFECLLQHHDKFRNKLKADLNCGSL